jgi:hypothetical protein
MYIFIHLHILTYLADFCMSPDDDCSWSKHLVSNNKQKQNGFTDVSLCDGLSYDLKILA